MRSKKLNILLATAAVLAAGFTGNASAFSLFNLFHHQPSVQMTGSTQEVVDRITSQTDNLRPQVLALGLTAYEHAHAKGMDHKKLLTIVDYSLPSTTKRMWVINLANDKVLFNTLVAHGKNSGDNYATHFSNNPTSDESSLGVFLTGGLYNGEHGMSMRLMGLEPGFNSNAMSRGIVMHSAWYVNPQAADALGGRLGRSWGCLALDPTVEPQIVNTIKNGTIIFSYYPSKEYINHSQFLKPVNGITVSA